MGEIRVTLFGRFCVCNGDRALEGFEPLKVQELFAYLLLFRDHMHNRESLANILWPDKSIDQSRYYLRRTLWQLQSAINAGLSPEDEAILAADPDWIQVNCSGRLHLDVAVLEAAAAMAKGMSGFALDGQLAGTLAKAANHYQGNLLEGWYQSWCVGERERLQYVYLSVLDKLMQYCEAQGDYESGLSYGMDILRYDPAREHTHRGLMRLHHLAGHRTDAIRQFERCAEILDSDLGLEPANRTMKLKNEICQSDASMSLGEESPEASERPGQLDALCEHLLKLEAIQADLEALKTQVDHEVKAVASLLNGKN